MCTGGSLAHNAANTRTYGRWIVFKTAGGSQALEPSCDLVLPQRPGPIALRLQAEFQYTRIFNEPFPSLLWPRSPLSVFLILEAWSFSFPLVFESRTNCPCSMLLLFFFFFFFFSSFHSFPLSIVSLSASPPFRRPPFSLLCSGFLRDPPIPGELVRSAAESTFYISPPRICRRAVPSPTPGFIAG